MKQDRGFSLIEVMITIFVLAVGLLGLAGLQARALNAEVDAVSRGQALLMLNDLADRMASNLTELKASTTAGTGYNQQTAGGVKTVFGTGYANDCISVANNTLALQAACCAAKASLAARDLCEWDLALKGTALTSTGGKVGSVAEVRACVFRYAADVFEIDVVWRGRGSGASMAADMTCGSSAITSSRSGVSRRIRVAQLDAI